jgi:hypothetical protein
VNTTINFAAVGNTVVLVFDSTTSNWSVLNNFLGSGTETFISVSTAGIFARAATDLEQYYFGIYQDIDSSADRLNNVITYGTSAGGGAQISTTTATNAMSQTAWTLGSSSDWRTLSTGDIYTLSDNSGYLTRSNWIITIGNALAAGIYWCEFAWTGMYNNATAQDLGFSLFINGTTKTGLYSRTSVNNVISRTQLISGFVTLQNADTITPKCIAGGNSGILTNQMSLVIRRYSKRIS